MVFRIGQDSAEPAGGRRAESEGAFSGAAPVSRLQQQLTGRLSPTQSRTLASLAGETEAELFGEGLLDLARRVERSDNLEAATLLYRWIGSEECPILPNVQARARRALDAIEGRGEVGARAEFLLGRFFHEASNPSAIFAMGAAGALFRMTRLATLARLGANPEVGFLTRGFGARAASSLTGFTVEATAFPFLHRAADAALGHSHPWDLNHVGAEVASSFLTLGALKFCGWGAGAAFRRTQGLARGLAPSFSQQAFQQAGMFGGILLGHGLETTVGLRQPQDGATSMVDALAMLLQFNVAGNLSRRVFGQGFHQWEQSVDLQAEALQRPQLRPPQSVFGQPALAMAGISSAVPSEAGSRADLNRPNILMMSADRPSQDVPPFPVLGFEGESEVAARLRNKPEVRFDYPPEAEADLSRLEAQMRAPGYLEGSREDLLRRRPDSELVDRIWLHQLKDFLDRVSFARYVELDDSVFLSRMEGYDSDPDAGLVHAARERLGERGRPGSTALKVIEIRASREALNANIGFDFSTPDGCFDQFGGVSELQSVLGERLQLLDPPQHPGDRIIRIPSLSYAEALLQNAVGADKIQFHPVDGAIPRDQIMSLRARRVVPVGMTRGMVWFGDVQNWTYPAPFSTHDGVFHGSLDSQATPGSYEFSQRLYHWLWQNDSGGERAENFMDRLADGELRFGNLSESKLGQNLRVYFEEAVSHSLQGEGPDSSRRLRDIGDLLEDARSHWTVELGAKKSPAGLESSRWENLYQEVLWANRPRIEYPPEIEAAWRQIEQSFAQPSYYEGDRRQLRQRRPDPDAVDAVWLYQAAHFAEVQPKTIGEYRDAEAILEINPPDRFPLAAEMLREALDLLGERGRPGSKARQVLFMRDSDHSERGAEMAWQRYVMVPPVLNMTTGFLRNRLRLETYLEGNNQGIVPSLSLLEALYQVAQGRRVQFHPVPGEIPRDTVVELRRRSVSPIGLSRQILHMGHTIGGVHPFSFSAHDSLFHAGVIAQMPEQYPRTAGWLYDRGQERLPEGPIREDFLDALADINVSSVENFGMKMFRSMMEESLANSPRWLQEPNSPTVFQARAEVLQQTLQGFRRIVGEDFNSQGGLVRAKGSFLKALDLVERRFQTARRLRETSDALEIGAPPLRHHNDILDALREIDGYYQAPGYYEGTRAELLAKRPPLELADRLWLAQAFDFADRIPDADIRVREAEILLEPLREDSGFDQLLVETAIRGLPGAENSQSRKVLEIWIPGDMTGSYRDKTDMPELQFLVGAPSMSALESALNGKVHLQGNSEGGVRIRIPSLSLSERLIQAVQGEDRFQFHPVPGALPRDVLSSLQARGVSAVSLSGTPDGAVHPWFFSQRDALERAAHNASIGRAVPEAADWLYTRIRDSFPDSSLREATLDRLTDLKPTEFSSPFEALSNTLFQALREARDRVPRLGASEQKGLGHETRVLAEALRQLIREEFAGQPDLAANRRYFEERLAEVADVLDWSSRTERDVNYLSRIQYPPAIQTNWDAIVANFGRHNYLNADPVWLARNRMPEDLVDRHWAFQIEDWARSFPGVRSRILDLDVYFQPSAVREIAPDGDLLRRAVEALGERGQAGSLARRVVEVEFPIEVFEEHFNGGDIREKSGVMLGSFFSAEEMLDRGILLVEPTESSVVFRIPSLSFYEKVLQARHGADRVAFHYVHGSVSRDQKMALNANRAFTIGLSRNNIFIGDLEELVHPFYFTAHDAFIHATRDAVTSDGFLDLAPRLYRYLGRGTQRDDIIDEVRSRLADLDNQVKDVGGLSGLSRDLIFLLNRAYQNAGSLEGEARLREIAELDSLSSSLHAWIRSDMPRREDVNDQSRASLEVLMGLRRALREEVRPASRSGRRSR